MPGTDRKSRVNNNTYRQQPTTRAAAGMGGSVYSRRRRRRCCLLRRRQTQRLLVCGTRIRNAAAIARRNCRGGVGECASACWDEFDLDKCNIAANSPIQHALEQALTVYLYLLAHRAHEPAKEGIKRINSHAHSQPDPDRESGRTALCCSYCLGRCGAGQRRSKRTHALYSRIK